MAKRVVTIDSSGVVLDKDDRTLGDALSKAGKANVPSVTSPGVGIIHRQDFGSTPIPDNVYVNPTDIEKGGLRDRLLEQEVDLIARSFLCQFPGQRRNIVLEDNWLTIENFPLPDKYSPDYLEYLFIVISGYPQLPPAGVHIDRNSTNLSQIAHGLGGHVLIDEDLPDSYKKHVAELESRGWRWICYHYNDWQWKLNPRNLLEGDCLYKYVESLFATLSSA